MTISRRRVWAIVRKELREFRRNRSIVFGMAIFPLVFSIQPLIAVLGLSSAASGGLSHEHVLLYLLGIPTLAPVFVAGYAVAGERQQGSLEPALTTPIRSEEFLLGKAISALLPSLGVSFLVYALFLVLVELFSQPTVAAALIQGPDLFAPVLYAPLLATWTIWVATAISTRASDPRVAQQLSVFASIPPVLAAVALALNAVPPTPAIAVGAALLLVGLDVLGWWVTARLFDRERLISGTR